jgi:cyanate lyase
MQIVIAFLLAVALLAGGLLSAAALAQGPNPPTVPSTATPSVPKAPTAAASPLGDVFWKALADKLGKDVASVQAAFREAAKAVVAQRVKDGQLKQELADKLNQRIDRLPLNKPPVPIWPQKRAKTPQPTALVSLEKVMLDAAANTLNMNSRDLIAQLRDGLTLGEIAQQKGVDPNKVKTALLAVANARIDEAVKHGKLTQDKAAELKAKINEQADLNKRFPLPKTPARPAPKSRWP